ncbi:hypothetical protein KAM479_32190 [Aeromonas caviae]|nr:hypothetical protein KAM335_36630 [Aeromonas caviae]GJA25270.1 hypothetical protein KAM337_37980 [Aeromonas caviae]GJB19987.1 hypothetical protein KAM364_18990 [Aeromonas caviae]GKR71298.1 hypothetical protein KAM479_32190 [Aeromonas caviae]
MKSGFKKNHSCDTALRESTQPLPGIALLCSSIQARACKPNMFNFKQLNSYLKRVQALGDGLTPARPPAPVYRQAESGKPLVR